MACAVKSLSTRRSWINRDFFTICAASSNWCLLRYATTRLLRLVAYWFCASGSSGLFSACARRMAVVSSYSRVACSWSWWFRRKLAYRLRAWVPRLWLRSRLAAAWRVSRSFSMSSGVGGLGFEEPGFLEAFVEVAVQVSDVVGLPGLGVAFLGPVHAQAPFRVGQFGVELADVEQCDGLVGLSLFDEPVGLRLACGQTGVDAVEPAGHVVHELDERVLRVVDPFAQFGAPGRELAVFVTVALGLGFHARVLDPFEFPLGFPASAGSPGRPARSPDRLITRCPRRRGGRRPTGCSVTRPSRTMALTSGRMRMICSMVRHLTVSSVEYVS